ncbi:hypothetical protein BaRGS_00037806, partial [Batillaria attramentaria]
VGQMMNTEFAVGRIRQPRHHSSNTFNFQRDTVCRDSRLNTTPLHSSPLDKELSLQQGALFSRHLFLLIDLSDLFKDDVMQDNDVKGGRMTSKEETPTAEASLSKLVHTSG